MVELDIHLRLRTVVHESVWEFESPRGHQLFGLVAERQTRRFQKPVPARAYGFKSLLDHQIKCVGEGNWQT